MRLNELRDRAFSTAVAKGWHDDKNHPTTFGDRIALIHSEVSEALEEFRAGRKTTEVYYTRKCGLSDIECLEDHPDAKPSGIGIELADVIVRILDLSGREGIDIEKCVDMKMAYNEKRQYRHGGKTL